MSRAPEQNMASLFPKAAAQHGASVGASEYQTKKNSEPAVYRRFLRNRSVRRVLWGLKVLILVVNCHDVRYFCLAFVLAKFWEATKFPC